MTILALIAYLLIGCIAGFLSGLFGIGGGVVTVPCLALIFYLSGFEQAHTMQMAIGTSLAAMVITTIASTWAHHHKKGVMWDLIIMMLPGIILGCVVGSVISHLISGILLEIIFGLFAIALGIHCLRPSKDTDRNSPVKRSRLAWSIYGFLIGGVASLLGIGGGIITVPLLVYLGYPDRKAIGSSVASGFVITLLGALLYLYLGLGLTTERYSIGYLYLPAFIFIGITTIFSAVIGTRLAHTLPTKKLRKFFGAAMIIIGIIMVI